MGKTAYGKFLPSRNFKPETKNEMYYSESDVMEAFKRVAEYASQKLPNHSASEEEIQDYIDLKASENDILSSIFIEGNEKYSGATIENAVIKLAKELSSLLPKAQQNAWSKEKVVEIFKEAIMFNKTEGVRKEGDEFIIKTDLNSACEKAAEAICSLAVPTAHSEEVTKEVIRKIYLEYDDYYINYSGDEPNSFLVWLSKNENIKSSHSPQALEKAKEILEDVYNNILSEDMSSFEIHEVDGAIKKVITLLSNETSK